MARTFVPVLILVRHSMPAHGPHAAARDWTLSPAGRSAAAALCRRLPADARLVASSEPKALETLASAGPVLADARFDEVTRTGEYGDGFRDRRRAYLDGTDHAGWESRSAVAGRFDDGVADHVRRAAGRPVVVATHGMAMTLWLSGVVGLADPAAFWDRLRFPDAYLVDREAGTVVEVPPTAR